MDAVGGELNLARKWRPRHFGQLVGQQIPVVMLRNSLRSGTLFPVYLFEGQHGCGKTSTARIFATAINCTQQLTDDETQQVPCLTCDSCVMMAAGSHPDFIEIDAASHTGVDHVRGLIESSSYMPLVGKRKIFLIDEVHMLSKSAFNALLKVLEEPSSSALFMLATTEVQKLPETVVSRCFRLHFSPLPHEEYATYLGALCAQEGIAIQHDALSLLVQQARGAGRDAINLLERVRFASTPITYQRVLEALGKTGLPAYIDLLEAVVANNAGEVLTLAQQFEEKGIQPAQSWAELVHLGRVLLWAGYGVKSLGHPYEQYGEQLRLLARRFGKNRLFGFMQVLWSQEQTFLQTTAKQACLELTLLQLCQQVPVVELEQLLERCQVLEQTAGQCRQLPDYSSPAPDLGVAVQTIPEPESLEIQESEPGSQSLDDLEPAPLSPVVATFIQLLEELRDPFLHSILRQAIIEVPHEGGAVVVTLHSPSKFFKQQVEDALPRWQPLLARACGQERVAVTIMLPTTSAAAVLSSVPVVRSAPVQSVASKPLPVVPPRPQASDFAKATSDRPLSMASPGIAARQMSARQQDPQNAAPQRVALKLDAAQWPVAHKLLHHFPGTLFKRS